MLDKELLSKWTDEAREFFKVRHVKGDIDKVIGYNYWRNFFSTKWLKKILHIKEKQTI